MTVTRPKENLFPALQVTWRKLPNRNPLTIGTSTWVKDKRIHAEHVPNSSQWNLVIEKVNATDAGTYECQVSARGRQFRQQVDLEVKGTVGADRVFELPNTLFF